MRTQRIRIEDQTTTFSVAGRGVLLRSGNRLNRPSMTRQKDLDHHWEDQIDVSSSVFFEYFFKNLINSWNYPYQALPVPQLEVSKLFKHISPSDIPFPSSNSVRDSQANLLQLSEIVLRFFYTWRPVFGCSDVFMATQWISYLESLASGMS
jgi:hypothetical protein